MPKKKEKESLRRVICRHEIFVGSENLYVVEFALIRWLGDHEHPASVFFR